MKKAASIFLRAEITPRDIQPMIRWLENPRITRYLNEDPHITRLLRHLLEEVPAPMLSLHFNRDGRLFLVCRPDGETIGFVKLRKLPQPEAYEIVYVIGEESLWGQGFGEASIHPFGSGNGVPSVAGEKGDCEDLPRQPAFHPVGLCLRFPSGKWGWTAAAVLSDR